MDTHFRWETLIISMGGSSFPRSPRNANVLPEEEGVKAFIKGTVIMD